MLSTNHAVKQVNAYICIRKAHQSGRKHDLCLLQSWPLAGSWFQLQMVVLEQLLSRTESPGCITWNWKGSTDDQLEQKNWKNVKQYQQASLLIGVSKPWHSEVVTSRHTWHNFRRFEPSQHCFDFFWLNPNTTDLHLTKASKIFKDSSQSVLVSRTTGNRSLWYLLMIFVYGILWQIPTRCHQVDSLGVESAAHESACRSTRPITCQWKCYWCSLVQGKSRAVDSLAMLSLPPVDRLSIFPCHQCGTVGRRPGWRRLGRGPSQDSPVAPAWVSTHFSSDNSGCFQ